MSCPTALEWVGWKKNYHNTNEARKVYQKACDKSYRFCRDLGKFEEKHGNIQSAIKAYKRACYHGMDIDDGVCFDLGSLEEKRGNIPLAAKAYKIGCDYPHTDAKACSALGSLEEKRGDIASAKKAYSKLCSSDWSAFVDKVRMRKGCLALKRLGGTPQPSGISPPLPPDPPPPPPVFLPPPPPVTCNGYNNWDTLSDCQNHHRGGGYNCAKMGRGKGFAVCLRIPNSNCYGAYCDDNNPLLKAQKVD